MTCSQDVKIRVIELMDHVLSTYDRKIGEYTAKVFKRNGVELVLESKVASVRDGYVKVSWAGLKCLAGGAAGVADWSW